MFALVVGTVIKVWCNHFHLVTSTHLGAWKFYLSNTKFRKTTFCGCYWTQSYGRDQGVNWSSRLLTRIAVRWYFSYSRCLLSVSCFELWFAASVCTIILFSTVAHNRINLLTSARPRFLLRFSAKLRCFVRTYSAFGVLILSVLMFCIGKIVFFTETKKALFIVLVTCF